LNGVSFTIKGEMVAPGPSGSGKTTLMSIIGCLDANRWKVSVRRLTVENMDDETCEVRGRKIDQVSAVHLLARTNALKM
jgi:ABC-type lipoprotein export system ATPase subunit